MGIHCAAVIALFAVKFTVLDKPAIRDTKISLVAPVTPDGPPPPASKPVIVRTPLKLPKLPAMATLPPPLLAPPPVVPPPVIQPPAIKAPPIPESVAVLPSPPVAPPKPAVQTDVFSSVAKASAPQPASAKVQTGGFSGASAAAPQSEKVTQIVAAGFGDAGVAPTAGSRRVIATGAGFGDAGVATAQVTRRGVATAGAGFGDAGVASGTVASKGAVRASNFGDTVTAAPAAAVKQIAASPTTAAQILEKPKPAYTEEARSLKIEGQVQLEVRFRATGQVEIVRVVRGLGHGLDENAAQAARTIRFLPAKRDGQPVDSTATVYITFQLAS